MEKLRLFQSRALLISALALLAVGPAVAQQDVPPPETQVQAEEVIPGFEQKFVIDRSDRMTVPVSINGSETFPFIVDTGAERTVIASDLAKYLKLEPGPQLRLATITGPAMTESWMIENLAMNTVKVDLIEAPGLERRNLGAYGLLGIDSLEEHKVLLDFQNQKLEVLPSRRKSGLGKVERGMIIVTAKRKAGRMILSNAEVGGIRVDIILDTGAQSSMGNFALRDRLRNRNLRFAYTPVLMRSVTGEVLTGDFTQVRDIVIGGVTISDLPVTFADNFAFKALQLNDRPAILLGMDALKLFDRVLVDFANRRVGFDLPKGAGRSPGVQLAMDKSAENAPSISIINARRSFYARSALPVMPLIGHFRFGFAGSKHRPAFRLQAGNPDGWWSAEAGSCWRQEDHQSRQWRCHCGTSSPCSIKARIAPIAIMSLAAKIASNFTPRAINWLTASWPDCSVIMASACRASAILIPALRCASLYPR